MDLTEKAQKGIFDGEAARKGYNLNKMCYTFNTEEGRKAFFEDEDAYCAKFGLNEEQRAAIRSRDRIEFVMAGGSLYYFGKFIRMFPGANNVFAYTAQVKD